MATTSRKTVAVQSADLQTGDKVFLYGEHNGAYTVTQVREGERTASGSPSVQVFFTEDATGRRDVVDSQPWVKVDVFAGPSFTS